MLKTQACSRHVFRGRVISRSFCRQFPTCLPFQLIVRPAYGVTCSARPVQQTARTGQNQIEPRNDGADALPYPIWVVSGSEAAGSRVFSIASPLSLHQRFFQTSCASILTCEPLSIVANCFMVLIITTAFIQPGQGSSAFLHRTRPPHRPRG